MALLVALVLSKPVKRVQKNLYTNTQIGNRFRFLVMGGPARTG